MRAPHARVSAAFAPALALACAITLGGCADEEPAVRIPRIEDYSLGVPYPMPPLNAVPLDRARFRVVASDVRYDHDGTRASLARLETTLATEGVGEADLYELVAERFDDGARAWRVATGELRIRDLQLVGDARGATILPSRLTVDLPGRPRLVGTLAGSADTDASGTVRGDASLAFGGTALAARGSLAPSGSWNATVSLAPLALADAHAFASALPSVGFARGVIVASGGDGAMRARTSGLVLATDQSELRLSGGAARSATDAWSLDSVLLVLDPVHPDDWRAWLGSEPIVDAPLRGRLLAHGGGRDGIDVDGSLLAEDSAGSRLAADVTGTLWLEPEPRMDLAIESRSLRLADTGPLDLDVRLSGGADSLAFVGSARLASADSLTLAEHPLLAGLPPAVMERLAASEFRLDGSLVRADSGRRVSGTAEVVDTAGRVWVALRGFAPVGGDGPLDVVALADSLPLSLVPTPSSITNLTGFARLRAHASGTVAAPSVEADAELVGARFDVPAYGTGVDSMFTHVRLAGQRIELVDVRAFHGEGSLVLTGGVDLGTPLDLRDPASAFDGATIDVTAVLDTMTVVDIDSARAVLAGALAIGGPLDHPRIDGRFDVIEGHVFEGKLAPDPPLDPEDPPYGRLVADAPWPSGRLSAIAALEAADTTPSAPLPLSADVTVGVRPAFRIIDEDSDLGALGDIHVVVDETGAYALGDARIVDGFYAYYGELFQLSGGAFAVDGGTTRLAMSGTLRASDRPLGLNQGGYDGLDRRDPPVGIFGYSTPATVLELLRHRSPVLATQPEIAALLLFDVPHQAVDAFDHDLVWRGDEPEDLVGHRSAIQGSGLAWSYVADELYDWVPLHRGYMRAGTVRIGSRYPGWIMLGTQLEGGVHLGDRFTARATQVVGGGTWPGVGLRYALREHALVPADRHVELFNEPRFSTALGTSGPRADFGVRRRTGLRVRWLWDY